MPGTVEILERLVAFNTVSRESNDALIGYVAGMLREAGGAVRVLPGVVAGKSNLLASFGPSGDGGILLSGHSDVVPVDGQAWSTDPFVLTGRGDRLLGRGACDMKGFIAAAIHAGLRLDAGALAAPLHIAISHDEEIGCVGVRTMLATLAAEDFRARGAVIGEPTSLRVATGHKGKIGGCICCVGQAAHSAAPELGCNAIYLATGMVEAARVLQAWLVAHGARDAAYAVPHGTVHIGTIAGGTVVNIVPDRCDVGFEIRYVAGDDPAALVARLRAAGAEIAGREMARGRNAIVDIRIDNEYPGLATDAAADIAKLVCDAAGTTDIYKAGFGTEAGLFKQVLNLPAVVCGPGSIDRAHKPDEYVTTDELAACDGFLDRVIAQLRA